MLTRIATIGGALLLAASFGAAANDLMVTPLSKGGSTDIKLEFVNSGNVTALEFDLKLVGIDESRLDYSACTKGLYTNHSGACSFRNGVLTVIVFSPSNEVLPTLELGHVKIDAPVASIAALEVSKLVMADAKGNQVTGGNALLDNSRIKGLLSDEQVARFKAK